MSHRVRQKRLPSGSLENMHATANPSSPIGFEIAKRMADLGIRPTQLAKQAGISIKTISRLTNGHTPHPRNDTLKKIADVLGCKPSEFMRSGEEQHGNDRGSDHTGLPG